MVLVRLGLLEGRIALCTQQGARDSAVVNVCPQCTQLLSSSAFPSASQVTDTGRLLHTLPGRSHLSHSVPWVSCSLLVPLSGATLVSTAQCLALSLEWKKKKLELQETEEAPSSESSDPLQDGTGPLSKLIESSKSPSPPLERLLRPWTD